MAAIPLWLRNCLSDVPVNRDIVIPGIRMTSPVGTELLSHAKLQILPGHRYGLIGNNGVGKSTLLSHIAAYDFGLSSEIRIVHVTQDCDVTALDTTPVQLALADPIRTYLTQVEETTLTQLETCDEKDVDTIQRYLDGIYARLEQCHPPHYAERILTQLGFNSDMMRAPLRELSGGWRMRAALAQAVVAQPPLLLLDEVSNHLDTRGLQWLQQFLTTYAGSVVLISHDRVLLNAVCTDVIDFRNQTLTYYRGNADACLRARKMYYSEQLNAYTKQQQHILTVQQFIHDHTPPTTLDIAQAVKQRRRELDKITAQLIPEPVSDVGVPITFPSPPPLDHDLVVFDDVSWGYDTVLIQHVTDRICVKDRIGIIGPNGCGKSTLFRIILQQVPPLDGMMHLNPHARISIFTQHHIDQLPGDVTAAQHLTVLFPDAKAGTIVSFLCGFGLTHANVTAQNIATLSGGQKARVAFAVLNWRSPHLLLLDEITNNLDLHTIDALIEALQRYSGAVMVISHDRYFLTQVCTTVWEVRDTAIIRHDDVSIVQ